LVDDGQIIVLGGLIEDNYSDTSSGIPFLKDIPYLGALFRSDSKTRTKTNLLVFIRPYILRDKDQVADITGNRLNLVQQTENNFKQAPMLLPKENLPRVSEFEPPLVPPGNKLPASGVDKAIPVRPSVVPSSSTPVPVTIQ
jgi:general secretion pathway protein D